MMLDSIFHRWFNFQHTRAMSTGLFCCVITRHHLFVSVIARDHRPLAGLRGADQAAESRQRQPGGVDGVRASGGRRLHQSPAARPRLRAQSLRPTGRGDVRLHVDVRRRARQPRAGARRSQAAAGARRRQSARGESAPSTC